MRLATSHSGALWVLIARVGTLMSLIHTGEHEQMRTLVEALGRCGSGELLALSPLLKSKPVAPQALQAQIVRGQAVGVDADADA